MMMAMIAGNTNGIFCLKLLIGYPVQNPGIQKLLQTAINRCTVNLAGKGFFQICVGQRGGFLQESLENFHPLAGLPEIETLQYGFRLILH